MQKSRVRRVGALLVGLALVATACGDDETSTPATEPAPATTAEAPATTAEAPATTAEAPATTAEAPAGGELAGMKGTTPKGADVSDWIPAVDEFWQAQGNDPLEDFNYAARPTTQSS